MITDRSVRPGKPERPPNDELLQIINSLERAEHDLEAHARKLLEQHDYSAEFPSHDAESMRQAIAIIRQQIRPEEAAVAVPADVVLRKLDRLILWLEVGKLGDSIESLSLADFKVLRELAAPLPTIGWGPPGPISDGG